MLTAWIVAALLVITLNGGDYMFGFRFMVTVIPVIYVAIAVGLAQLGWFEKPQHAIPLCVLLLLTLVLQVRSPILNHPQGDLTVLAGRVAGEYINGHLPHGSTIALNAAGAAPFIADDFTYIDMLGLNDREIARRNPVPLDGNWIHLLGHVKADGQSVLRRRPGFIILGPPVGREADAKEAPLLSDHELTESTEFRSLYSRCSVTLEPTEEEQVAMRRFGIPLTQQMIFYVLRGVDYTCPQ